MLREIKGRDRQPCKNKPSRDENHRVRAGDLAWAVSGGEPVAAVCEKSGKTGTNLGIAGTAKDRRRVDKSEWKEGTFLREGEEKGRGDSTLRRMAVVGKRRADGPQTQRGFSGEMVLDSEEIF